MIHISEEQVREALPMAQAVDLVEESFRRLGDGRAVNHPRRRVTLDNGAWLHYMAAGDNEDGYLATKVYATRPRVGARFAVLLFDAETTELLATIDANALGQIRTGAASGAATRHMAREDARQLGMIGCGFQAETQLEAVAAVRDWDAALVYSRTPERRESFAKTMSEKLGLDIRAVDRVEVVVTQSDVLTTITTARRPLFTADDVPQGCHINAAGSNHAKRAEVGGDTVARAGVVAADSIEQARMEAGDLIQAHEAGVLDWDKVVGFSAVVLGTAAGRTSRDEITLFESQGLAIQDLIVAAHVYKAVTS